MAQSVKLAGDVMAVVRREAELHSRSVAAQITHWLSLGKAIEQLAPNDHARVLLKTGVTPTTPEPRVMSLSPSCSGDDYKIYFVMMSMFQEALMGRVKVNLTLNAAETARTLSFNMSRLAEAAKGEKSHCWRREDRAAISAHAAGIERKGLAPCTSSEVFGQRFEWPVRSPSPEEPTIYCGPASRRGVLGDYIARLIPSGDPLATKR